MSSGPRALQRRQRIAQVLELVAQGYTARAIMGRLAAEWDQGRRNVRRYMTLAFAEMRAADEEARPMQKARIDAMLSQVFTKAMDAGNHGAAATAAGHLARINGLDKLEVAHTLVADPAAHIATLAPAAQRSAIAEMIARAVRDDPELLELARAKAALPARVVEAELSDGS